MRLQALLEFITECNFAAPKKGEICQEQKEKTWTLFTDGSSTTNSGGAGVILTSLDGFKIQQAVKFLSKVTNNEAEYEALIAGLQLVQHLEVSTIEIFSDSQLILKY